MNSIKINNSFFLIFLFFISSCNLLNSSKESVFKLEFSKHPQANSKIYSQFHYNSELDTISLGKNDYRSIRLFLGIFKEERPINILKSVRLDTFIALDENLNNIPFYLKFEKKGDFIIDGYVEDKVFLDNYYNDGKTRIITLETKVTGKVQVVD